MAQAKRFSKKEGGKVLSKVKVHLIFWGAKWKGEDMGVKQKVDAAAQAILNPKYCDGLKQYADGSVIDATLFSAAGIIDPSEPPNPFNHPADVVAEITRLFATGSLTKPDDNRYTDYDLLYLVIMPREVMAAGDEAAGQHGYFRYGAKNLYFGWVLSGLTSEKHYERITSTLSEEIVEAITDPELGSGWLTHDADGVFEELCDVCEGVTYRLAMGGGEYAVVKTYYSNHDNDCFPVEQGTARITY